VKNIIRNSWNEKKEKILFVVANLSLKVIKITTSSGFQQPKMKWNFFLKILRSYFFFIFQLLQGKAKIATWELSFKIYIYIFRFVMSCCAKELRWEKNTFPWKRKTKFEIVSQRYFSQLYFYMYIFCCFCFMLINIHCFERS
jgi:hypothetical protein